MNFSSPKVSRTFFIGAYQNGRWQGGFQQRFFGAKGKQERQCVKLCVTLINVYHIHDLSLKRLILQRMIEPAIIKKGSNTQRRWTFSLLNTSRFHVRRQDDAQVPLDCRIRLARHFLATTLIRLKVSKHLPSAWRVF